MTQPHPQFVTRAGFRKAGLVFILATSLASSGHIERAHAMAHQNPSKPSDLRLTNYQDGFMCEIRSNHADGQLQLEGVVRAMTPFTGSYSFTVTKQGRSGSSSIAQRGLFTVRAQEERVVGTIVVNQMNGDNFLARLQIMSGDNESICDFRVE